MRRGRPTLVALVVAAGCTSSEREMVDPPDIPASSEVWVDPMFRKPEPVPSPEDSWSWTRYALGRDLVFLTVIRAEADAGHRVVHSEYWDDRYSWIGTASSLLCAEQECADGCVAEMHVPRRGCGLGLDDETHIIAVEVSDCGPDRRYMYSVHYEPLHLVQVHDEKGLFEEEIPEEDILED